ncbi:MAG: DHHA1 domain-containing protein [Nanoarchaeota archaeon]
MPLTEHQVKEIKEELDNCKNPLYFFHDDPDGLSSFLLLYRYKQEGNGVIVKRATPTVDEQFVRKVNEYNPDKIFILDIAVVDQNFVDNVKVPIIWIDHHEPLKLDNIKIFNPRLNDKSDGTPVTYLCHQVVQQDLWIAAVGCIGDWFLPDFIDEFNEQYPDLVKIESKDPGDILFNTKLGTLARIFSFILKGNTSDVKRCYKTLTRIKDPYEILEQKSPQGRFVYKKFTKINKEYTELIEEAKKQKKDDGILIYIYPKDKMSFSGDLANELLHKFPDKLIIVGREKDNEIKMSLRYCRPIIKILKNALKELEGGGGGHEYACGANIKTKDFDKFIDNIKKNL